MSKRRSTFNHLGSRRGFLLRLRQPLAEEPSIRSESLVNSSIPSDEVKNCRRQRVSTIQGKSFQISSRGSEYRDVYVVDAVAKTNDPSAVWVLSIGISSLPRTEKRVAKVRSFASTR